LERAHQRGRERDDGGGVVGPEGLDDERGGHNVPRGHVIRERLSPPGHARLIRPQRRAWRAQMKGLKIFPVRLRGRPQVEMMTIEL